MNVLAKIISCLALACASVSIAQAQCINSTNLAGPTEICEKSRAFYFIDYDSSNGASVSLSLCGWGNVVHSRTASLKGNWKRAGVIIEFPQTPGIANKSSIVQILKTGIDRSGNVCSHSERISVRVHDITSSVCR